MPRVSEADCHVVSWRKSGPHHPTACKWSQRRQEGRWAAVPVGWAGALSES